MKEATKLMDEMDLDKDGQVDYYEFLSYSLGRRAVPVELLVYDIGNDMTKKLGPWVMGNNFEHIYHTSIVVFGQEWWYFCGFWFEFDFIALDSVCFSKFNN